MVFSEVNLCSMARTERYKMTIDLLTRQPLELYDMENDPDELRNLVGEPRLAGGRNRFLAECFSHLVANLNEPQLKVFQDGGIPNFTRNTPSTECVTSCGLDGRFRQTNERAAQFLEPGPISFWCLRRARVVMLIAYGREGAIRFFAIACG